MPRFCQHGRLWTTCPECGKDVIRRRPGRRPPDGDATDLPRAATRKARPVTEQTPEDGGEADR